MKYCKTLVGLVASLVAISALATSTTSESQTDNFASFDLNESGLAPGYYSLLVDGVAEFSDSDFGEIDPVDEKGEFTDSAIDVAAKSVSVTPAPVAEPGTLALLGAGMIILSLIRRRL